MSSASYRRRLARRAQVALLSGLTCFGLFQLGVIAAIETRFPEFRDPLYGRKLDQLRKCVDASPGDASLVLLLGSSRIYNGVEARVLKAQLEKALGENVVVYNFGLAGAGPLSELIVLNRLLAGGVKPDLVLLEIFPAMFADVQPLIECDVLATPRLWHADLDLLERCDRSFATKRVDWYRAVALPCHTYRYGIIGRFSTQWLPAEGWGNACFAEFDPYGWQGLGKWQNLQEERKVGLQAARLIYEPKVRHFRPGVGIAALRELLQLCRSEELPAVLLFTPEGDEFASWYSPHSLAQIEEGIYGVAHEADVPVIDARRWMSEEEFFDSHHLLAGGAERFSRRLGCETVRLISGEVQTTARTGPLIK